MSDFRTIALCLPSLARGGRFAEAFASAINTCDDPTSVFVILRLDNGERDIHTYQKTLRPQDRMIVAGQVPLSNTYNDCYRARSDCSIYMYWADDMIFRTKGWDSIVKQTFRNMRSPIGLVGGNDQYNPHEEIPTFGFLSKEWIDTVGYMCINGFTADYADIWLGTIGIKIRQAGFSDQYQRLPHLVVQHMRHKGIHSYDKTYRLGDQRRRGRIPPRTIWHQRQPELAKDADKLIEAIRRSYAS